MKTLTTILILSAAVSAQSVSVRVTGTYAKVSAREKAAMEYLLPGQHWRHKFPSNNSAVTQTRSSSARETLTVWPNDESVAYVVPYRYALCEADASTEADFSGWSGPATQDLPAIMLKYSKDNLCDVEDFEGYPTWLRADAESSVAGEVYEYWYTDDPLSSPENNTYDVTANIYAWTSQSPPGSWANYTSMTSHIYGGDDDAFFYARLDGGVWKVDYHYRDTNGQIQQGTYNSLGPSLFWSADLILQGVDRDETVSPGCWIGNLFSIENTMLESDADSYSSSNRKEDHHDSGFISLELNGITNED